MQILHGRLCWMPGSGCGRTKVICLRRPIAKPLDDLEGSELGKTACQGKTWFRIAMPC